MIGYHHTKVGYLRVRPMPNFKANADRMVDRQLRKRGMRDEAVLAAMLSVPRHEFVDETLIGSAYDDRALPTAHGQTISQPYIVGKMTEMLQVGFSQRVLEVGTGSGYQAAILAQLGAQVMSIEFQPELAQNAQSRLKRLGYQVDVLVGDGTLGWPERAPFNRIIVTAAAPNLPPSLTEQLSDGGRIVIPLGTQTLQHLTLLVRSGGVWSQEQHTACRFVPLVGKHGWEA